MLNSRRSHGLPFNDEQIDDEKRCWRGVVIAIRNTKLSDWIEIGRDNWRWAVPNVLISVFNICYAICYIVYSFEF